MTSVKLRKNCHVKKETWIKPVRYENEDDDDDDDDENVGGLIELEGRICTIREAIL